MVGDKATIWLLRNPADETTPALQREQFCTLVLLPAVCPRLPPMETPLAVMHRHPRL
jgi:hypothetical protein